MIEELYTIHFQELLAYIVSACRNREEAEDIVQECFASAMANLDVLEELSRKQRRAWLYKCSKNIMIDRIRKKKSKPEINPQESTNDDLSIFSVNELLTKLPSDEATIFSMRYFYGYNSTEIGKKLSLPPGTVRSKLSSARSKLRRLSES